MTEPQFRPEQIDTSVALGKAGQIMDGYMQSPTSRKVEDVDDRWQTVVFQTHEDVSVENVQDAARQFEDQPHREMVGLFGQIETDLRANYPDRNTSIMWELYQISQKRDPKERRALLEQLNEQIKTGSNLSRDKGPHEAVEGLTYIAVGEMSVNNELVEEGISKYEDWRNRNVRGAVVVEDEKVGEPEVVFLDRQSIPKDEPESILPVAQPAAEMTAIGRRWIYGESLTADERRELDQRVDYWVDQVTGENGGVYLHGKFSDREVEALRYDVGRTERVELDSGYHNYGIRGGRGSDIAGTYYGSLNNHSDNVRRLAGVPENGDWVVFTEEGHPPAGRIRFDIQPDDNRVIAGGGDTRSGRKDIVLGIQLPIEEATALWAEIQGNPELLEAMMFRLYPNLAANMERKYRGQYQLIELPIGGGATTTFVDVNDPAWRRRDSVTPAIVDVQPVVVRPEARERREHLSREMMELEGFIVLDAEIGRLTTEMRTNESAKYGQLRERVGRDERFYARDTGEFQPQAVVRQMAELYVQWGGYQPDDIATVTAIQEQLVGLRGALYFEYNAMQRDGRRFNLQTYLADEADAVIDMANARDETEYLDALARVIDNDARLKFFMGPDPRGGGPTDEAKKYFDWVGRDHRHEVRRMVAAAAPPPEDLPPHPEDEDQEPGRQPRLETPELREQMMGEYLRYTLLQDDLLRDGGGFEGFEAARAYLEMRLHMLGNELGGDQAALEQEMEAYVGQVPAETMAEWISDDGMQNFLGEVQTWIQEQEAQIEEENELVVEDLEIRYAAETFVQAMRERVGAERWNQLMEPMREIYDDPEEIIENMVPAIRTLIEAAQTLDETQLGILTLRLGAMCQRWGELNPGTVPGVVDLATEELRLLQLVEQGTATADDRGRLRVLSVMKQGPGFDLAGYEQAALEVVTAMELPRQPGLQDIRQASGDEVQRMDEATLTASVEALMTQLESELDALPDDDDAITVVPVAGGAAGGDLPPVDNGVYTLLPEEDPAVVEARKKLKRENRKKFLAEMRGHLSTAATVSGLAAAGAVYMYLRYIFMVFFEVPLSAMKSEFGLK